MTLVEFLLARIAEDEADLKAGPDNLGNYGRRWSPARVLAECKAKRQIVAHFVDVVDAGMEQWDAGVDARVALGWLAWPYSSHPDYRGEWAP